MKIKRGLGFALSLVLLLSTFTGCASKKSGGELPEGTVTLTVGIPQNGNVSDYDDNAFTKYLEDTVNVDLKFLFFSNARAEYMQQLALMCGANEKLPDVIVGFEFSHYTVNEYGEDGYFIDLTDYIEDYAPNYKKQIEKLDEDTKEYVLEKGKNTETGAYYGMPRVLCEAFDDLQSIMYINQNWLNKLGLKIPTTIEELKTVLTAFKTQDPNGNGQADEMTIVGRDAFLNYIINAFVCYSASEFNVTDGQVWDPIKTNEFRQALIYANELVSTGLYDKLCLSNLTLADQKTIISPVGSSSKAGIFVGHHERMTNAATNALDEFVALPALADATGKGGYTIVNEPLIHWTAYITKDCKYPAVAMKFIDAFYEDETITRQRHGEKDVDWVYEEGENVIGSKSYTRALNSEAFFSGNCTWCLNACGIMTQENYLLVKDEGEGRIAQASRLAKEQWDIIETGTQPKEKASNLTYTKEEYQTREDKAGTVNSYINEHIILFVSGEKNVKDDTTWNEFMKTLDELGRNELLEVCQKAYDRK